MSEDYGNYEYSRYGHDDSEKCMSLTDQLDSAIDSGIASMTMSELEQNRYLDERVGSFPSGEVNSGDSLLTSSGGGAKSERPQDKTDTQAEESMVTPIESGFKSLNLDDEPYEPFIPHLDGFSPLHVAIFDGDTDTALAMIEKCPEPAALDYFTKEVHTALHLAVYSNLPEVVRFLVIFGANFKAKDQRGNTPLHTACELGRHLCVQTLLTPLEKIENFGYQKLRIPQDINEKNYEGLTPLHLATKNNHSEIVEHLVRQPKINVNIGDSTSGRTALHHALERRHKDCFMQILKGSVNVNTTTYDGCSPLHVAVGLELVQETKYLVTRGADIGIETTDEVLAWDLAHSQKIRDALQCSMIPMMSRAVKQR